MRASVTYSHRSSTYLDSLNPPAILLDAYGKLDASLTADLGRFTITAFGRYIADTRFYDHAATYRAGPIIQYVRYGGQPATCGLELTVKL